MTSNFSTSILNDNKLIYKSYKDDLHFEYYQLFSESHGQKLFDALENEIIYLDGIHSHVQIYDKIFPIPRKHVAYGDIGLSYTFSGVTLKPKPWTPLLLYIKKCVEKITGEMYNFVLINRYKDGSDKIADHKDDEKELVPNSNIASVSLGQERDFVFKRNGRKPVNLVLKHGTLLVMKPPTNLFWTHGLPKRLKIHLPRINLTFRRMKLG